MQNIINAYVLKGAPCAVDKLYATPSNGGIGLINLDCLLTGLKTNWLRRIYRHGVCDNWSRSLMIKCCFNFLCFRLSHYELSNGIEWNIAKSFWSLSQAIWRKNIFEAPIFCNDLIVRGLDYAGRYDANQLDSGFLGLHNYNEYRSKILRIRIRDLWLDNTFCEHRVLNNLLGFDLPLNKFLVIRRAVLFAIRRYAGTTPGLINNNNNFTLLQFLRSKMKGCGPVRRILAKSEFTGMNMIRTFANLINLDIPDMEICKFNISYWNNTSVPNWIRNFTYQFFRNSLPLGARAHHRSSEPGFLENGCKNCHKMMGGGVALAPCRETFSHTFWDCVPVHNVVLRFVGKYFPTIRNAKQFLFYGLDNDGKIYFSNRTCTILLLYEIWCARQKKFFPSIATIEDNMWHNVCYMLAASKKIEKLFINDGNPWFRSRWPAHNQGE
jgi:hypothetical protein